MKNRIVFLGLAATASVVMSCDDDDVKTQSLSTVQFAAEENAIIENSDSKSVLLNFTTPASSDGIIEISADTTMLKYFDTTPAIVNGTIALPVEEQASSAFFMVTPKNDFVINENRLIQFKLKDIVGNFLIGTKNNFTLTIQDDESTSALSYVNFVPANATISETYKDGYALEVQVSESSSANGEIVLIAASEKALYGQHYVTEPAFTDGQLSLAVAGSSILSFKVIPLDNNIINGDYEIDFSISQTTGNVVKGTTSKETFRVTDDELSNKPKGYTIGAGSWGLKRLVEYDEAGRISEVYVESATPGTSTRTETYFYSTAGLLEKINEYPGIDEIFTWENGRIVKSEKINHGEVKSYALYDYDDLGNVSSTMNYYLQPDGQFKLGTMFAYLYFTDGNLYKVLGYVPDQNGGEPLLISTRTFDGYIDKQNPFPMVDILPTVKSQTKLPSTYRVEENGVDLLYNLSYTFRPDGLVAERIATGGQTTESATYLYY